MNFMSDPEIKFVKQPHLHTEGESSFCAPPKKAFKCRGKKTGTSFVKDALKLVHECGLRFSVARLFPQPRKLSFQGEHCSHLPLFAP